MATPSVSAAAGAIIQYLKGNFYDKWLEPKASLVKAMIVHSSVYLKGYASSGFKRSFSRNANPFQGHGRMELDKVLHFGSESWDLFMVNSKVDSSSPINYEFKVNISSLSHYVSLHSTR